MNCEMDNGGQSLDQVAPETGGAPFEGTLRIVDLSDGIAGAYCTKALADAGAEVIKVEPPQGASLRRRSASGHEVDPDYGGVLFQFLSCSKASVVADPDEPADLAMVQSLIAAADAVVWSRESTLCAHPAFSVDELRALAPHALVLALTPYGLTGPWVDRPANEFTLQAASGSAWNHGSAPDGAPLMIGASQGDYALGTAGAVALLMARTRALQTGEGELIDVAGMEVMHLTHIMFPITFLDLAKRPWRLRRSDSIPGIHPTKDGWVGLWVTTGQQWLDFCTMTERFDWLEDPSLGLMDNRSIRHDELVDAIDGWASTRTTAEIVELASLLRVPVAPIGNGATLPTFDHYIERHSYTRHPCSGVTQPDVWYSLSGGAQRRAAEPSPALGEHTERYRNAVLPPPLTAQVSAAAAGPSTRLPFEGVRVADMTAFWAGPIITHGMAMLGADVIHIESTQRPDGIRMAATIPMSEEGWWETSPFFNGTNTCKRDLAINLQTERGHQLMLKLVAECDVLVENFSVRVMDQLGLGYEELRKVRPDLIMLRAQAFGTSGPWKDRVGYAPTIDQAGGLSWTTGVPEGPPLMIGAASDAVGGLHGTLAVLYALEYRRRTGRGMLIESPQIGPALNVTAELVAEYSAHGALLGRIGNRSYVNAPQGVYRVADRVAVYAGESNEDWVAISIETTDQWLALCGAIGNEALGRRPDMQTLAGRQASHDEIDDAISAWCRPQSADEVTRVLTSAGVPAATVVTPHEMADMESAVARDLYEMVHHPVAGDMRIIRFPVRFSKGPDRWHRSPSPCLGEHNRPILEELLGLSPAEVDALEAEDVIGNRTSINLGW